jgi:heme-degrading monooxygenase HmoA
MVTIGMNYDVRPGKEPLFEERFHDVLTSFAAGSGHVSTRLYRDVVSPGSYLIHSEWDSRESFLAFIRSDAFREVTEWGREEILVDRPRHRIYGDGARV